MKQKLVIKVSMNGHASRFCCFGPQNPRSKALRLAAGFPGVQSAALAGDRDRIEVTGDVDVVNLATLLRKKVGFTEIVSVSEDKKEGESENKPRETNGYPVVWSYPRHEIVYVRDPYCEPSFWPL